MGHMVSIISPALKLSLFQTQEFYFDDSFNKMFHDGTFLRFRLDSHYKMN